MIPYKTASGINGIIGSNQYLPIEQTQTIFATSIALFIVKNAFEKDCVVL